MPKSIEPLRPQVRVLPVRLNAESCELSATLLGACHKDYASSTFANHTCLQFLASA